jgi:putative transposase
VADITYVAIRAGFVYLSVILDAWSRRVIGHGLARDLELLVLQDYEAIALDLVALGLVFFRDRLAGLGVDVAALNPATGFAIDGMEA